MWKIRKDKDNERFVTTEVATSKSWVENTWDHLLNSSFDRKKHYYEEF